MDNLMEYRIENDRIVKVYINGINEILPYSIENEKACLLELKESITMLEGYIESCEDNARKDGIIGATYLAVSLYFGYSFLSEADLLKFIFMLIALCGVKYKIDSWEENTGVVNDYGDKDISIIYKTKLQKKNNKVKECSSVFLTDDEYEAENKNIMHLKFIREQLEEEKDKLKTNNYKSLYVKEYKIN